MSSTLVTFGNVNPTVLVDVIWATAEETGQLDNIFVLDLPECVRIRTGDRGNKAIG